MAEPALVVDFVAIFAASFAVAIAAAERYRAAVAGVGR